MWPFAPHRTDAPLAEKIEPALHSAPAAAPANVEQKASAVGALISARVLNLPQWPRRNFEQSAKEGYQQNPIVNACIWKTTRAAAAVPLAIMQGDKEVDIPELRALLNRPNPAQDGPAFVQSTLSDLMLAGEFFAERVDLGKRPRELYRWSPAKTAVRPGADGFAAAYTFKVGDKERTVEVDLSKGNVPVLHVRDYNPTDDWRGLPSIDPAAFSVDAHTGALRWNVALLRNGAQPSGALVYAPKDGSDKLTDEQWERLKAELEESFSGSQNAGKPLLLDGGLDWKEMGFSPKDMNFAEGLNSAARLIALAFGVPPLILGIPGDNTFANYTEANKAWYRETILPLLSQWCRAMSWWIGPAFGKDIRIEPDTDDLEVFADERAAEWDRIEKSTILTIDEKRERLGYGKYRPSTAPGGQILVSSALIPLEATGEMPQGGAEPAQDEESDGSDEADVEDDGPAAGEKSFNRNQPRDPAGTATGGRWTSGASGTLTEPERHALVAYAGGEFLKINRGLYGVDPVSDETRHQIETIDAALRKSTLLANATVYRGVGSAAVAEMEARRLRKGSILPVKGFMSTSKARAVAMKFAAASRRGVLIEIAAKSGSHAIDFAALKGADPREKELLFPRNSRLKVISFDRKKRILKVVLMSGAHKHADTPIEQKKPSRNVSADPLSNRFVFDPIEIEVDNSEAEGEPFDFSVEGDADE